MLVVIHDISYLQRQTTKNYHLLRIIKDKKKVKLYFSEYQSNIEFFIRFFLTTGRYNISNYLFFSLSVSSTSSVIKKLRGMNISRENSGIVFCLDKPACCWKIIGHKIQDLSRKCRLGHVLKQKNILEAF